MNVKPKVPYVYQPYGVLSDRAHAEQGRLWGVGLPAPAGIFATVKGLTKPEAEAVRDALAPFHTGEPSPAQAALARVADAIRQSYSEPYVGEADWNPDAHLDGVTLTIADARAVFAALSSPPSGAAHGGAPAQTGEEPR